MSLEASFAAVETELKTTRSWMRDVAGKVDADHDDLIRLQGQVGRLEDDVLALRGDVRDGFAAVRKDFKDYKKEQQDKEEAQEKEERSRNWALILAIVGPFISAIIAAVTTYLMTRGG